MFRVVHPPIIRSAYNCIHSTWYLSDRYCYLPRIAVVSSNGLTNTRCYRYSCMRSWPPEICRAVSIYKLCKVYLVEYILEYMRKMYLWFFNPALGLKITELVLNNELESRWQEALLVCLEALYIFLFGRTHKSQNIRPPAYRIWNRALLFRPKEL